MFIRKLYACCDVYDFSDVTLDQSLKEAKLYNLQDIVEYISSRKGSFTPPVLPAFMTMVTCNIIRALPVGNSTDAIYDAEEDEPYYEASWVHLELVYELLRKFIVSSDSESRAARQLITTKFVTGVVELFNTEDPREREYLKTILHRIYGKVMPLRAPIRRAISHSFYRVVHERARHNGISELLEILGSIINGFSVPLKEEHKTLLRRALLPLHAVPTMPQFHVQLSFCVTQYVHKEPTLAVDVMKELVKHWPVTHTRKEIMFLGELEEVLELVQVEDMAQIVVPVFRQIARCTTSMHFQVAERVLYFWNSQHIVTLFEAYRKSLMPIFVGALHENLTEHWNPNVQNLSYHVQNLLRDLDMELYEGCMKENQQKIERREQCRAERDRRWERVQHMADSQLRRRRTTGSSTAYSSRESQKENSPVQLPTTSLPALPTLPAYETASQRSTSNSKMRTAEMEMEKEIQQQQQKVFIEESTQLLKTQTSIRATARLNAPSVGVDLSV